MKFVSVDMVPALPVGWQTLEIASSDYRPNTAGDGMILRLDCVGTDGARHMVALPLESDDAATQQAGQAAFAALRSAIGVMDPDDTEQLHFRPFEIHTGARGTRLRPVQ